MACTTDGAVGGTTTTSNVDHPGCFGAAADAEPLSGVVLGPARARRMGWTGYNAKAWQGIAK